MHKVLWAESGSAALMLNLGRRCGARSPLFLEMPFILPSFIGESSLANALPSARGSQPQFLQSSDELSYGISVGFPL